MITKGMSPERREAFLHDFADVRPHPSPYDADAEWVNAIREDGYSGPHADLTFGYYVGFLEDYKRIRGVVHTVPGVQFGFNLYAGILSKVAPAFYESPLRTATRETLGLVLHRSFDDAVLPILNNPNAVATAIEGALGINSTTVGTPGGYEVVNDSSDFRFRAKPELVRGPRTEVDEEQLAASGLSYEEFLRKMTEGHCLMPLDFHRKLWQMLIDDSLDSGIFSKELAALTSARLAVTSVMGHTEEQE